jgi:hypothetical protein
MDSPTKPRSQQEIAAGILRGQYSHLNAIRDPRARAEAAWKMAGEELAVATRKWLEFQEAERITGQAISAGLDLMLSIDARSSRAESRDVCDLPLGFG